MKYCAGVDEVGRGPLAGHVTAAAVILNPYKVIDGLKDSKQLSPKKREYLSEKIKAEALAWAIARVEATEIDKINIFQASLLAMQRAVEQLSLLPELVLVDGKFCPKINMPVKAVIKGDQLVPAISAASIIAKVQRDADMCAYDQVYPGYGFAAHKGYGTQQHIAAIQQLGLTPIHRRSFKFKLV